MAKITKQEFENWSKKFDKIIYNHILNNSMDKEEENDLLQLGIILKFRVREGNILAAHFFLSMCEGIFFDKNKVCSETDGLTAGQCG